MKVEAATKDNNESILNIALSYTSREEMTQAVRSVAGKVSQTDEVQIHNKHSSALNASALDFKSTLRYL